MNGTTKFFHLTGLTAASVLYLWTTSQLSAQPTRNCAPRDKVVERLADRYGETRQSVGLGNNNAMVEVFASDESGSWTITITAPNGVTCLVASGNAFETVAEVLPTKDSDA